MLLRNFLLTPLDDRIAKFDHLTKIDIHHMIIAMHLHQHVAHTYPRPPSKTMRYQARLILFIRVVSGDARIKRNTAIYNMKGVGHCTTGLKP
ncbi:MAG: hypothetical protein KBT74_01365 [Zhongshania sp.]|nr:hypothetical protein [Zhongshania sp.]MBQ0794600.1 hypothetical protein [Zhongshania sp.]